MISTSTTHKISWKICHYAKHYVCKRWNKEVISSKTFRWSKRAVKYSYRTTMVVFWSNTVKLILKYNFFRSFRTISCFFELHFSPKLIGLLHCLINKLYIDSSKPASSQSILRPFPYHPCRSPRGLSLLYGVWHKPVNPVVIPT